MYIDVTQTERAFVLIDGVPTRYLGPGRHFVHGLFRTVKVERASVAGLLADLDQRRLALVPASTTINITSQQRDALQRSLSINFQVSPVTTSPWPRWLGGFLLCLFLALSWVWGNRLRRLHSA